MAENTTGIELDVGAIVERIREDNKLDSPHNRAKRVYNVLQEHQFTLWDMLCFCAEFSAMMVGSVPWLAVPAKILIRGIYSLHYVTEDMEWLNKTIGDQESQLSERDREVEEKPIVTPGP